MAASLRFRRVCKEDVDIVFQLIRDLDRFELTRAVPSSMQLGRDRDLYLIN